MHTTPSMSARTVPASTPASLQAAACLPIHWPPARPRRGSRWRARRGRGRRSPRPHRRRAATSPVRSCAQPAARAARPGCEPVCTRLSSPVPWQLRSPSPIPRLARAPSRAVAPAARAPPSRYHRRATRPPRTATRAVRSRARSAGDASASAAAVLRPPRRAVRPPAPQVVAVARGAFARCSERAGRLRRGGSVDLALLVGSRAADAEQTRCLGHREEVGVGHDAPLFLALGDARRGGVKAQRRCRFVACVPVSVRTARHTRATFTTACSCAKLDSFDGFEDGRVKVFQNVSAPAVWSARDRHWEVITMRGHVAKKGNRYYARRRAPLSLRGVHGQALCRVLDRHRPRGGAPGRHRLSNTVDVEPLMPASSYTTSRGVIRSSCPPLGLARSGRSGAALPALHRCRPRGQDPDREEASSSGGDVRRARGRFGQRAC